eukprot:s172_g5.t1
MQGRLSAHPSFSFNREQTAILKMCLIKLLSEAVDKFDVFDKKKAKDQTDVHWLEDPTALGWLRNVLKKHMDVQGVIACLQPWSTPTPEPQLTVDAAPLRLLMRGSVESWSLQAVEDLRELSLSQWHEPLNLEDDWLIADKIDSDDDQVEGREVAVIGPEHDQLQPLEQEEENPDGAAEHPGSLKPIFDFRRLFTRLPKLAGTDDITAKRLILGLHERLWHASYQDVKSILIRCGMPHAVWRLASDAVASCRICRRFARAGRRPQSRGADLSISFNEVVQIDLFTYGGQLYLLTIDEATRYKIATTCHIREMKHVLNSLLNSWIRYFGPMRTLVSDQET